jgi:hypothetical protein
LGTRLVTFGASAAFFASSSAIFRMSSSVIFATGRPFFAACPGAAFGGSCAYAGMAISKAVAAISARMEMDIGVPPFFPE